MKPAPIHKVLQSLTYEDLKDIFQDCPTDTLLKLSDVATDLLAERNAIAAHFVATLLGLEEDFDETL